MFKYFVKDFFKIFKLFVFYLKSDITVFIKLNKYFMLKIAFDLVFLVVKIIKQELRQKLCRQKVFCYTYYLF